jgi:hypothetical protein
LILQIVDGKLLQSGVQQSAIDHGDLAPGVSLSGRNRVYRSTLAVPQLALSPDGSLLAVVDANGRTYLWHLG